MHAAGFTSLEKPVQVDADFPAYHWSLDQCEYATDIVFRRQRGSGRDL